MAAPLPARLRATNFARPAIFAELLGGVTLAALPWVVVDVRQAEPEAFHVTVALPLPLARAALLFVAEDATRVEIPELARFYAEAEKMVRLLAGAPDAELVRVSSRDEEVIIAKVGDHLRIGVETRDEEVRVRIPLSRLEELLSYYDAKGLRFPTCSMSSKEFRPVSSCTFAAAIMR